MAVLLNTSAGDLVIDLFVDDCPLACKNFLKLCSIKYYNNCLFYNVQQNYVCQAGDPTGTGSGGQSIYGILGGKQANMFDDEIVKGRKVNKVGLVGMAHIGDHENTNRSQFFITLRGEDMEYFEGRFSIFGEVAEGFETLEKINALYCDEQFRPYQDVRIAHTCILDDPFPDLAGMQIPSESPQREYPEEEKVRQRIPYSEKIEDDDEGKSAAELEESIRRKEAKSRAIVLEMTGDIPDADVKPPVEVLFVAKLNPVTTSEDLELIFSRFGTIKSCEVIRDFKTGDSLNYAFVEFETESSCVEAFEKMNNVLIDDRRIKVDFSQSVSKLWNRFLMQPRKDDAGKIKSEPIKKAAPLDPRYGPGDRGNGGRPSGDFYRNHTANNPSRWSDASTHSSSAAATAPAASAGTASGGGYPVKRERERSRERHDRESGRSGGGGRDRDERDRGNRDRGDRDHSLSRDRTRAKESDRGRHQRSRSRSHSPPSRRGDRREESREKKGSSSRYDDKRDRDRDRDRERERDRDRDRERRRRDDRDDDDRRHRR